MKLEISWQDASGIERLSNALGVLDSHKKHLALQRAVNHTGAKAKTQVIRALAKQTGLKSEVIRAAVKVNKAWGASADPEQFARSLASKNRAPGAQSLHYSLTTRGGDISLKHFKARETLRGVTASPFGERKLFPGTFIKGGRFPNRVTASGLNGHVYEPESNAKTGKSTWRRPVSFYDSGVIIPVEMLKGATADAFTSVVNRHLANRVNHEINRLCPGIFV
ncbi:phage tail protein [Rhizobium sp. CFBP 8762]|uniref:phage tail protein n=1 Tax=Rhizobium sp. CFBP 8762 TaxID=2775279 RepID=UPI00177D1203|nr:phage tail protein [Rhizobium sp. CFBP 8762]MBD8556894.1 phage tail protein [Rhizobium sp. CFBP 8762]